MDAILAHYQSHLSEITLKPSSGGVFDITVDGEVVFSKHQSGRFPEKDEVIRLVGERIRT
nr:MAG: hypothetical protein DIU58_00170 [Sphaerobacter thermophilus]